jgi:nitroreductase
MRPDGGETMILDLLRKRFSVRAFKDTPVPDNVLRDMLEAGRLSPSGGNEQPWMFGVVTDPSLRAAIAEAAYGQRWIADAPLLIVLCTQDVDDEREGRGITLKRFPELDDTIAALEPAVFSALCAEEHQTKIAGAHMALVALEHGIGSTWVSKFNVRAVADLIKVPAGYQPSEILAFGTPADMRPPKAKKPLDQVTFYPGT